MEHYSGCLIRSSGAYPLVLARGHVVERSKLDIGTRPDVFNMYHKVGPSACYQVCTQTKVSSDKFFTNDWWCALGPNNWWCALDVYVGHG